MKITSIKVIKQATAQTSIAKYDLEYSISNGILDRVNANINKVDMDNDGNEVYVGNISFENGTINCALPMSEQMAQYFEDFEGFLAIIQADVDKMKRENEAGS